MSPAYSTLGTPHGHDQTRNILDIAVLVYVSGQPVLEWNCEHGVTHVLGDLTLAEGQERGEQVGWCVTTVSRRLVVECVFCHVQTVRSVGHVYLWF